LLQIPSDFSSPTLTINSSPSSHEPILLFFQPSPFHNWNPYREPPLYPSYPFCNTICSCKTAQDGFQAVEGPDGIDFHAVFSIRTTWSCLE
jgi:hypothetical protein